jgi:hypothetical protein
MGLRLFHNSDSCNSGLPGRINAAKIQYLLLFRNYSTSIAHSQPKAVFNSNTLIYIFAAAGQ